MTVIQMNQRIGVTMPAPMSPVSVFENQEFGQLRIVQNDGEPWFVAADVCAALEIENVGQAISALDEDEKSSISINDGTPGSPVRAIISEPGLYSLVLRSRKPEAKAFKRWITHDVLPAIRKTGSYTLPDFTDPAISARAWAEQYERRQIAESQRDEAIRTKAEIGTRREATSMNTASRAVKKTHALEDELGIGRNYRQVKAIEWLREEFDLSLPGAYSQIGRKLSELSGRMNYPARQVPDERYPGGIKAYHIDVVEAFRAQLRLDLNMLRQFRRRMQ